MSKDMILAILAASSGVISSTGMWAFIQSRRTAHTAHTRLLLGLAYDKIITNGMRFIERGWITKDEYEEYLRYLVEPYKNMGGNGVADRISSQVATLPFRTVPVTEIVVKGNAQS